MQPAAPAAPVAELTQAERMYGKPAAQPARLFQPSKPAAAAPAADLTDSEVLYGSNRESEPITGLKPPVYTDEQEEAAHEEQQAKSQALSEKLAQARLDATPEHIRELRSDPARVLFSPQVEFAQAMPDEAFFDPQLPPEASRELAAEYREIAADVGMRPADLEIFDRAVAAPETNEQRDALWQQSAALLEREFGPGRKAVDAFVDAINFGEADPRRAAVLKYFIHDPNVMLLTARLARQAKTRIR